jgi:hypothetical protein
MGGEGSGRPPSVETLIKRQQPVLTPIANDMFIPNYSGLKREVKNDVAGDMLTATDDGTYITCYTKGTALFRIVKATGQFQVKAGYDSDTTF